MRKKEIRKVSAPLVDDIYSAGLAAAALTVDDILANLRAIVAKAVLEQGVDPADSFEHFDADFSGHMDKHEFKAGLRKLGIKATAAQCERIMKRFMGAKSKGIRYREFLRIVQPGTQTKKTRALANRVRAMISAAGTYTCVTLLRSARRRRSSKYGDAHVLVGLVLLC